MGSHLLSNAIEVHLLELDVRSSEALQASVGLQEVRFELFSEIDHVGTEGVKGIFLVLRDSAKNFFRFFQDLVEN